MTYGRARSSVRGSIHGGAGLSASVTTYPCFETLSVDVCRLPFEVSHRGTFVLVHIAPYTGYGPRLAVGARQPAQNILAKRRGGEVDLGRPGNGRHAR